MHDTLQRIATNGIHLRAFVDGEGPLVVFVHGFPESWYSWRHQFQPVIDAGFRVVAPDVRGYGGSDKPEAVEAYDMQNMIADVLGLIEALGAEQAILVGHDWGAPIVWQTAALHPERVHAVAALSVPYRKRGAVSGIQLWRSLYKDRFFYQIYFQEPGVAEAEMEADVRGALRRLYYAGSGDARRDAWLVHKPPDAKLLDGLVDPSPFPAWLSAGDLDYYVAEFEANGFRGPLNRYRNQDRDWARFPELRDRQVLQPALFIAGSRELVLSFVPGFDMLEGMRECVPDLEPIELIERAGHWIQQERPEQVNALLIPFLVRQRASMLAG